LFEEKYGPELEKFGDKELELETIGVGDNYIAFPVTKLDNEDSFDLNH